MSLQWTFIATFLYTEIGIVALLLLPFISPPRWQKIFRSKMLNVFRSYANLYFNIFIAVLAILFVDSIRDVRKYSSQELDASANPSAEVTLHMKLFRAQRNFYIALFSLTLFMVIRRMIVLISREATLMAESEAMKKQADSASAMAKSLMEKEEKGEKAEGPSEDELNAAKEEVNKLKEELKTAQADVEAMKKQSQSTAEAYDTLLAEHAKVQKEIETLSGEQTSKKDD